MTVEEFKTKHGIRAGDVELMTVLAARVAIGAETEIYGAETRVSRDRRTLEMEMLVGASGAGLRRMNFALGKKFVEEDVPARTLKRVMMKFRNGDGR